MRRGEIWTVNVKPVLGAEADKHTRPAVIVSGDGRNQASERTGRGVVTVVPLTSDVARVLDFQVLVTADALGALNPQPVAALDEALLIHLALT